MHRTASNTIGSAPALTKLRDGYNRRDFARYRSHRVLQLLFVLTVAVSIVGWIDLTKMASSEERSMAMQHSAASHLLKAPRQAHRSNVTDATDGQARKRFAYMFYATSDVYACAALQFMDRLVNRFDMDTTRIDLAVLHTDEVSSIFLAKMHERLNVRTISVAAIDADARNPTWLHSLTKLRAFQEWGYDRVVYVDADSTPMTNLDHLFDAPPAPLYAPSAYWLHQPFIASTLMVIEPSNSTFDTMIAWARKRGAAAKYDMDIINVFLKDQVIHLPGEYTVLSQDFRLTSWARPKLFRTTRELWARAKLVHFSCGPDGRYGKPWLWPSRKLSLLATWAFDPFFGEMFEDYWRGEHELCEV